MFRPHIPYKDACLSRYGGAQLWVMSLYTKSYSFVLKFSLKEIAKNGQEGITSTQPYSHSELKLVNKETKLESFHSGGSLETKAIALTVDSADWHAGSPHTDRLMQAHSVCLQCANLSL